MDSLAIKRSLSELKNDPQSTLALILECYSANSPKYCFSFSFKSIVDDKIVPITINGFDQLNERINCQRQALNKLFLANQALKQKINTIKAKSLIVEGKLKGVVDKTRKLYSTSGDYEGVYNIKRKLLMCNDKKEKVVIPEKEKEVVKVLKTMHAILEKMREEINK